MKNKLSIILFILLFGSIEAQINKIDKKIHETKEIHHIDVPIYIPFTTNHYVNQYMSDLRALVTTKQFVYENNGSETMKQKLNQEYSMFNNKYALISKEIDLLTTEEKKKVSKFITEKTEALVNIQLKDQASK